MLDSADFIINKKISCAKFSGTGGIEALLYVEESYRKICKKFKWNVAGDKLFNNFNLVLEDSAENHWDTITDGVTQTVGNFDLCMAQFRVVYSSIEARDIM